MDTKALAPAARLATMVVRGLAAAVVVTLAGVAPAVAQSTESPEYPYGLDPYKPSDAALLRDYGATLVSQTPLLELRKLDPYKPSHAALLREIGGGLPLWLAWYPGPVAAPVMPFPAPGLTSLPPVFVARLFAQPHFRDRARHDAVPAASEPPPASSIATLRRPESSDGVWILFEGRKWLSAGRTVLFEASRFKQVGEYDSFPVYRRAGSSEDLIYVPTRDGLLAPYRLKR